MTQRERTAVAGKFESLDAVAVFCGGVGEKVGLLKGQPKQSAFATMNYVVQADDLPGIAR